MFKNHHYLTPDLAKNVRCFCGVWDGQIVAFGASIAMPNGYIKNAWRGHRTVVLPDFQGMGIGTRFSDAIAQIHVEEGKRYFSRTAHPRMGKYREESPKWVATSKNRVLRTDIKHNNAFNLHIADNTRICYSHEFINN